MDIWEAIKNSDIDAVRRMLTTGTATADGSSPYFKPLYTPLHLASEYGDLSIIRLLLEFGVKPDKRAEASGKYARQTPFHVAAAHGHLEVVQLFLSTVKYNSVETISKTFETPFHLACSKGHFDIAKLLYEQGASIDKPATPGGTCGCLTPMHLAAEGGSLEILNFLIEKGASIEPITEDRRVTPLYLAIKNGHTEIVKRLMEAGADLSLAKEGTLSPLQDAFLNGHHEICEILMQKGMALEPYLNGKPLLHIAVERSSVTKSYSGLIALLCRCGADPNEEWCGPIPTYNSPNAKKRSSSKAMLLAAECEKLSSDPKIQIDMAQTMSLTPVHLACASGKISCLRALLDAGGRADWKSSSNRVTPYDLALENNVKTVVTLLNNGSLGVEVKSHDLEETTFTSPTYCWYCRSFIWGIYKQGWRCRDCNCPGCKDCKDCMSTELCSNTWRDSDTWHKQTKAMIPAADLNKSEPGVSERKLSSVLRLSDDASFSEPTATSSPRVENGVEHDFHKVHFHKPTWCSFCNKFIWGVGKQGYSCRACAYPIHKQCMLSSNQHPLKNCPGKMA